MENSTYNGVILHFNKIYNISSNGTPVRGTLLSHPLYYMQNDATDEPVDGSDTVEMEPERQFNVRAAKALLVLHSMPFDYTSSKIKSFFNNPNAANGGFEMVPYGFLALCGGLLYRKKVYEGTNMDILKIDDGMYVAPAIDETLLCNVNKKVCFSIVNKGGGTAYIKMDEILNRHIEVYVKNKLVTLFEKFVEETSYLFEQTELTYSVRREDNKWAINRFDGTTFVKFVEMLAGCNSDIDVNKVLYGYGWGTGDGKTAEIVDFKDTYSMGYVQNGMLITVYKEDAMALQGVFDKLYNHKTGVITTVCQCPKEARNNDCTISKTVYNNVLNGFVNTLCMLVKDYKDDKTKAATISTQESVNKSDNDLKKSIYIYIKQLWDKWYCNIYNNANANANDFSEWEFSTKWLNQYFLFIDTYYRNIERKLKLGCDTIYELYENSVSGDDMSETHVLTHLANIAERHRCNFFCYPDFINFSEDDKSKADILRDLFRPMPYNRLNDADSSHRFVIMRITDAQINGDRIQYSNDGFNIYPDDISPLSASNPNSEAEFNSYNERDIYQIPSFGVAYSRQNNSIFTSFDVGMDNIQATEQSIKSLCYISRNGNRNKRAVTFYGNDIYGVYSSYSYFATITMLGNVQIQPLMYFQLMNIPIFNGAYVIIEVRHTIQSGKFMTTFKGMKISRIEPPYTDAWFTIPPDDSELDDGSNRHCGDSGLVDVNGNPIDTSDASAIETTEDDSSRSYAVLYDRQLPVGQLRVENVTYASNDNVLFSKKSDGNYRMCTVGTNFQYADGTIDGLLYINGIVSEKQNRNMGGIVVFNNNRFRFCNTFEDFSNSVGALNDIKYAWQNNIAIYDGTVNYDAVRNTGNFNFQAVAENADGNLWYYVSDKPCTYKEFVESLSHKGVKNAIMLVSKNMYCWSKTSLKSFNGSKDKINDGCYTVGNYNDGVKFKTILYQVKQ